MQKFLRSNLNQTFDVLADMVVYPKIVAKDVAKEKTVIIEEIKMYHDLPQYQVLEFLDELLWPNHPLGKSLAGTPKSVSAISSQDLKKFHGAFYSPENIVVAACGNLKHEKVVRLVRAKFSKLKEVAKRDCVKVTDTQSQPTH